MSNNTLIKLNPTKYIDLGLNRIKNIKPKKILIGMNTWNFFGNVDTILKEINYADTNDKVCSVNLVWLMKEVKAGSQFYVIGHSDLIRKYYSILFQAVSNELSMEVSCTFISLEKFVKSKKLDILSKKDLNIKYIDLLKEIGIKGMYFDYIIMNPPYDRGLGGDITKEAVKLLARNGKCSCLMPLSNYKNGLYKKVETIRIVDSSIFEDVDITNNLCICTLRNKNLNLYKSWESFEIISFNKDYLPFYEKNKGNFVHCKFHPSSLYMGFLLKNRDRIFINNIRVACQGFNRAGLCYDFYKGGGNIPVDDVGSLQIFAVELPNKKALKNYADFVFNGTLQNKLIVGLHKTNGTVVSAIPQIDWCDISKHPLWAKKEFDNAVLDVMGLRWDGNKVFKT